jgi:hypothetical protein
MNAGTARLYFKTAIFYTKSMKNIDSEQYSKPEIYRRVVLLTPARAYGP